MTIASIRRRKAGQRIQGQRIQGQRPDRAHPGILSGQELRRLVAEMVD